MSSILTIIEATGTQGASVVTSALKDRKYKIRAITRNTSSPKAQALVSQSIEVVSTDVNDEASLIKTFAASFFNVFSISNLPLFRDRLLYLQ